MHAVEEREFISCNLAIQLISAIPANAKNAFNTPAQLQSLASILSSLAESSFVSRFHLAFVRLEH